jgi:pimeloyl-ACP methyl ester carboxylesterase
MTASTSTSILAPYGGARPPAPAWFEQAMAQAPERRAFDHNGAAIELLTWGDAGQPGLLFLHGDSAHADWWSFIAPFFASQWRCAAISWSGMGRSGRRAGGYGFQQWAREAMAAIDAADLDNGAGVMLVAHSLGGYPALLAAAQDTRIRGVISLDSVIMPEAMLHQVPRPLPRPHKVYATLAEALARFRFMPRTIASEHYAVDHIARTGLVAVPGGGWTWAFDPAIWHDIEARNSQLPSLPKGARCPLALIVGEASELIGEEIAAYMRGLYPPGTPFIGIPGAGHHIMVDQPIALIAALRACLAKWPRLSGAMDSGDEI